MQLRNKITLAAGVLAVTAALGAVTSAPSFAAAAAPVSATVTARPASVGSGEQIFVASTNEFANAWDGGPDINVYNSHALNNDFTVVSNGGQNVELVLSNNGGGYAGECIADAGNNQYSARAALVPCTPGGPDTPWGANFQTPRGNCAVPGASPWYNVHWQEDLAPSGSSNGSAWYLNTVPNGPNGPTCLLTWPAY